MEKYYTPSIEEFHVGFECESNYVLANSHEKDSSQFVPFVFIEDNFAYMVDAYTNDAYPSEFRVKCLDKEDIESLGWSNVEDRGMSENYGYTFTKKIPYMFSAVYTLRRWCTNSRLRIETIIGCLFDGTIKNKSELKVLLKQLGI